VPVDGPTYVSLQTSNNNPTTRSSSPRARASRARPGALQAISLGNRRIALQVPFDGEARLTVDLYLGKNELVRFYQEGYDGLPGLFSPTSSAACRSGC
jgi:hypothetical protein